jgi:hypothetical protein
MTMGRLGPGCGLVGTASGRRLRPRHRQPAVIGALGLAVVGVDFFAFRTFGVDDFGWYLAGGLIQLIFAGVAIAVDLERRPVHDGPSIHVGYERVDTLPAAAEVVGLARSPVATKALITANLLFAIGS